MPASRKFTEEELQLLHSERTSVELSNIMGFKRETIMMYRRNLGITKKFTNKGKQHVAYYKLTCPTCLKDFEVPQWRYDQGAAYCSMRCHKTSSAFKEVMQKRDNSIYETEAYRQARSKPDTDKFKRYKNRVHRLSEKTYQDNIDVINPNRHPRTLAGVEGGYQLDHIVTVRFGFDNNIPPEALSEAHNLRMLPWKKNLARNRLKN